MSITAGTRSVLMLHGFSQNANIFSKRLGALRKSVGKDVDLVFIDAPHILLPVDLGVAQPISPDTSSALTTDSTSTTQDALRAFGANEAADAPDDLSLQPRGWWKVDRARTRAYGIEETLVFLRDVLREKRFVVISRVGRVRQLIDRAYSQGAALAALLATLLERPHLFPPFLVDGQPPHPPFEFCVSVSGFKVSDPLAETIQAECYSTPTLHLIGKTDGVVIEERSRKLVDLSSNARVEEHMGGHFVPSQAHWRKFLSSYLKDHTADLAPPVFTSAPASTTNSGTATPALVAQPGPATVTEVDAVTATTTLRETGGGSTTVTLQLRL